MDKVPVPESPASIELGHERLALMVLVMLIPEMFVENEIVFDGSTASFEVVVLSDDVFA
jgi:hypothetical protein